MMGSKLDAKTIDATGFHNAMLVISWCAWRISIFMVAWGVVVEVGSITFYVYLLLYLFMNLMEYHELSFPLKDCIEATFTGLRINRKGRLENSSYSLSLKISFSLKIPNGVPVTSLLYVLSSAVMNIRLVPGSKSIQGATVFPT